jgi:hypothetical protein
MSSINAVGDRPIGGWAQVERAGWIHSAPFDACLLIFAPLLTLPLVAAIYFKIPLLVIAGGLTLAFAHYMSTTSFFFWKENREYHRSRWLAFVGGPLIIATVYFLILGFDVPYVLQLILFVWNTFHVARQNCGILSIYRNKGGVADQGQKQRHAANRAIIAVSFFLAFWNIDTHQEVSALFNLVSSHLGLAVKVVMGGIAVLTLVQLGVALLQRKEQLGIPETLFLATGLGFFWPYLFIRSSEVATFAMLLPHYVQYMSLVWLLHRRKFGNSTEGAPIPLLRISSKLTLLIPALFVAGFAFYLLKEVSDFSDNKWWFETVYLLVALEHFYFDGLIWSFRRPHVRQTILPFLLGRRGGAPA